MSLIYQPLDAEGVKRYIQSDRFKEDEHIAISSIRALSHQNNPRARKADILLILVYDNDRLVGYMGGLPDDAYVGDEVFHFCWASCLWVDPSTRGKGVAKTLLRMFFEAYDECMCITEYTPSARQLYLKSGYFSDEFELLGERFYMRMNLATILPPKRPLFGQIKPLLKLSDQISNGLINLRFTKKKDTLSERIHVSEKPSQEVLQWMAANNTHSLTKRDHKEWLWMANFPWLSTTAAEDEVARYHFSIRSKQWIRRYVHYRNEVGTLMAAMQIVLRDGHLKVPYFFSEDEKAVAYFVDYLLQIMHHENVDRLSIYSYPELIQSIKARKGQFIHQKQLSRKYVICKKIRAAIEAKQQTIFFHAGDGDCAFT